MNKTNRYKLDETFFISPSQEGDQVEVKVISMIHGKTSLTIKNAKDRPERQPPSYTKRSPRPGRFDNRSKDFRPKGNFKPKESFEDKMARFLKTSEENLSTLNRNTVSKQGRRGGRRTYLVAFFNVTQTNLEQSVLSYQLVIVVHEISLLKTILIYNS